MLASPDAPPYLEPMIHLVKLSVGSKGLESLAAWQAGPDIRRREGHPMHVTRMWPKREAELLDGGSIYWVIQGKVQGRQKLLGFDEVIGEDGVRRCGFVLDPTLVPVAPTQKRPFQGWRYLKPEDAPPDLGKGRAGETPLPAHLRASLAEIGVL